ncbi:MAG: WD40/YVTN/BNR-like repeat-containing protein [Paracoccaceae bacterium]|jgi:photosystem II stability/assembly factor-like uncharacterized protein
MEVSRADPAVICGIGHDGRIQRSTDGGQTWQASGQAPERLIDIATSPVDVALLYAATEAGLFISPDKGATWTPVIEGVPVSTVDSGADGVVRVVDLGHGLTTVGIGGEITPVFGALPDGYLLFLTTTSLDPLGLAALSANGRLVVSDDAGVTWTDVLMSK